MDHAPLSQLYRDHVVWLLDRYARALHDAGTDAVVLHAGSPRKRSDFDDQYWPLRVTPHFHHWLPLAEPDSALVLRPGQRPALVRLQTDDFWEQPFAPESDHWVGAFDVAAVKTVEAVGARVRELAAGPRAAFIGDDARGLAWGYARERVNPAALVAALDALRTRKTAYEVACLAEANRRAAAGHAAVRERFRAGPCSELELHLAYLHATGQDDPETPYKNIVALGPNAATLHHVSYGRAASSAQSLLVDAGASCMGYGADITRTWTAGDGAAASAYAALVDAVEAMQQRLCAAVRVGTSYEDLHDECHRQLSSVLRELDLVRLPPDEIEAKDISRVFLPHGLGHSLGLQTHDVGCARVKPRARNPFLRNTSAVETGQVFTIEPGVYFIAPLLDALRQGPHGGAVNWALVDALRPFGGVRIEDDVVVTGPSAVRNLTREVLSDA